MWDWEEGRWIDISILSKLGHEYSVFVSTFPTIRRSISNWKMPSLSTLSDLVAKEKDKLIQMGDIRISNLWYLTMIRVGSYSLVQAYVCHLIYTQQIWSHGEHILNIIEAVMFKFYSTFSFQNDLRIISHVDGNVVVGVQEWKGFFASHHIVWSTRVYEESSRLWNIFLEGMSSFGMDVPILNLSLPYTFRKIHVILFKEKSHSIKFFLHVGAFRVKSLSAIGTFDLYFSLLFLCACSLLSLRAHQDAEVSPLALEHPT